MIRAALLRARAATSNYDNYRRSQLQAKIANRQLLAAQTYADDDWDWNRWGPDFANFYGPFGPVWLVIQETAAVGAPLDPSDMT